MLKTNENMFLKVSKTGKEIIGILAALLILAGLVLVLRSRAVGETFRDETIPNSRVETGFYESNDSLRGRMAEKGTITAMLYMADEIGLPNATLVNWVSFRDSSNGAYTHVKLPVNVGQRVTAVWKDDDLLVFNGVGTSRAKVDRFRLTGSPLPTAIELIDTQSMGDSDSRHGDMILLKSGAIVAAWHQQGDAGPQGHRIAYRTPSGTWLPAISYTMCPTTASKEILAQHPADGSIWMFSNPDAWGGMCAAHFTETSNGLAIDWTDAYFLASNCTHISVPCFATPEEFEVDPENPRLAAAPDPTNNEIILTYQGRYQRKSFYKASDGRPSYGAFPIVAKIKSDKSKSFSRLPVYSERIAEIGVVVRPGEVWVAYRPVDFTTNTFNKLYVSKMAGGVWEPQIYVGTFFDEYDHIAYGISRVEFSIRTPDRLFHFYTLIQGPSDTTAPTVSITSPANGSTVSGTISINANASDNVGVTKVDYLVDGNLIGSDSSSPYSYSWNTTSFTNGSHTIGARAYDAAGNVAVNSISVTVSNTAPPPSDTTAPTVSITSPANGAVVTRRSTISIGAAASDNVGVSRVEFYVDGTLICSDTVSSYSCSWKVPGAKNRTYTISARAFDAAGNSAVSTISVRSN